MARGSDGGAMGHDAAYRLRPVRDARDRDAQVKRGELAAAVGDARTTEAQIAAAAVRVADARAALAVAERARAAMLVGGRVSSTVLIAAERFAARRRHALADALLEHAHATDAHDHRLGAIDDARARLTIARSEREVIERHFARWRDERRKAAERRQD